MRLTNRVAVVTGATSGIGKEIARTFPGATESAMAEWFVRYLDVQSNRETESRRMDTRDEAIALAREREREGCVIHSIVGPAGEEPWEAPPSRWP